MIKTSPKLLRCIALPAIQVPRSVTSIDHGCFLDCVNLTQVAIERGSKLKSIGEEAFKNATSLRSIDSDHCSHLESINSKSFEGCTSLEQFVIPASVRSLGDARTFAQCTKIEKIIIPYGVSSIPTEMCLNCHSLDEVIFASGSTVTLIG